MKILTTTDESGTSKKGNLKNLFIFTWAKCAF